MTATVYCPSTHMMYQIQLIPARSQFTSSVSRNSSSPSSSSSTSPMISISEIRSPIKINRTITRIVPNNSNNKHHQYEQIRQTNIQEVVDTTKNDVKVAPIDEEEFLSFVGLRLKTKKLSSPNPTFRPLAKRLAAPVCLLPLPKYGERVRHALNILLPFLKFLLITHDAELFCSTDEKARADSLLPRSMTLTRPSKTVTKKTSKRKVSRSEFITMASNTLRNNTRRTPMASYIRSTIQCQVVLDRLEQSVIDQIMQNSADDVQTTIAAISNVKQSSDNSSAQDKSTLPKSLRSTNQTTTKTTTTRTTITTMTTEKTTVKHKSTTTSYNDAKRFKKISDSDDSTLTYQRIYLKCFVCSKREYISAETTKSDILHSHWLEHDDELALNIYDSEIDSILTRVVEFFQFPKRHTLEGKIQTVFILNSEEIRRSSPDPFNEDDTCIILD